MGGTCWRPGEARAATVRLIGRWTFVAPSRRVIVCTDGTGFDEAWTDYVDRRRGRQRRAPRLLLLRPRPEHRRERLDRLWSQVRSCSADDTLDPTIKYTWTPQTFTLSSADGSNATLAASIPYIKQTVARDVFVLDGLHRNTDQELSRLERTRK